MVCSCRQKITPRDVGSDFGRLTSDPKSTFDLSLAASYRVRPSDQGVDLPEVWPL